MYIKWNILMKWLSLFLIERGFLGLIIIYFIYKLFCRIFIWKLKGGVIIVFWIFNVVNNE